MITISVYKQSSYPVSAAKIKKTIKQVLAANGIVSDFELSLALVGQAKMDELVKQYYKDDPDELYVHPILTFPNNEVKGPFVYPPKSKNNLGDIVISYPASVDIANEDGKLVEQVVCELAEHGCLHLLGIHH